MPWNLGSSSAGSSRPNVSSLAGAAARVHECMPPANARVPCKAVPMLAESRACRPCFRHQLRRHSCKAALLHAGAHSTASRRTTMTKAGVNQHAHALAALAPEGGAGASGWSASQPPSPAAGRGSPSAHRARQDIQLAGMCGATRWGSWAALAAPHAGPHTPAQRSLTVATAGPRHIQFSITNTQTSLQSKRTTPA